MHGSGLGSPLSPVQGAIQTGMARTSHLRAHDPQAEKAAREFEGVLLSSLLSQLQESMKVPGAEEEDSANGSMRDMALQALGATWADSGGIGLSRIVLQQLEKTGSTDDQNVLKSADSIVDI
jgi:Rod binding domain-containing protein